jgi:Tol biopolymer transport system component
MAFAAGTKLGPYEIQSALGAGGMGEVYRARDTRLERIVAIKVLAQTIADNTELKGRFEREARTISSLNHPHICQLYDVGLQENVPYLVMEYLEGETLAERLRRGPLPLAQLLPIAMHIADALQKAHRAGIVHRDLKPGNIMLTKSGAKLLDFGLAKPIAAVATGSASGTGVSFTAAPTVSGTSPVASPLTTQGTIVGTIQYMSPEQIEGKEADARSDLFAFGAVLYEMATGKRPFEGKSQLKVASAILEDHPVAPRSLQPNLPAALEHLILACLMKDPEQRLQSAMDAKLELGWLAEAPAEEGQKESTGKRNWWLAGVAAVCAMAAIVAGAGWWRSRAPVERPLTRLNVDLGAEALAGVNLPAAISPDGRRIVFRAMGADGREQLAMRVLDQQEVTFLPGTAYGYDPFFSPDGQWIGYFSGHALYKTSVQGGSPTMLAVLSVNSAFGASWGEDGNVITVLGSNQSLARVPTTSGPPSSLLKLGPGENAHRWPQVLPGGAGVIFTTSSSATSQEEGSIKVFSYKTGEVKTLAQGGYFGRYLPSGHLVYVRNGVLYGMKFDLAKLEVSGSPVPLLEDVAANPVSGGGEFDCSENGTCIYAAGKGSARKWSMEWLDSSGKTKPMLPPGEYSVPRFSPDGRKLAYLSGDDIYIYDLERDTTARLTYSGNTEIPVWSADGRHIVYGSKTKLMWVRSDGASEPQKLLDGDYPPRPWSFTPDGTRVAYFTRRPDTGWDLWTLQLDLSDPDNPKPGTPEVYLSTPVDELVPRLSPDGKWMAYRSTDAGNSEIYVRPYPNANAGKWQISTGGGLYALWSNKGHQLFYATPDSHIMVVDYSVEGGSFVAGKPRLWSDKQLFYLGTSNLDLAPDGQRFVVLTTGESADVEKKPVQVTMLLNFFDELRRRIP